MPVMQPVAAWLCAAMVVAFGGAASAADTRNQLPSGVTPLHYDIALTPDAAGLTFKGEVGIDVETAGSTATVTLNAADMVFDRAQIDGEEAAVTYDADAQTATLTPKAPLAAGKHRLAIAYRGKIYEQPLGLFAIDYQGEGGTQRLLATQFEAPDARRFIPSWDEPARKATFALTVTAPADQMVVSNMPAEKTTRSGATQTVRFATTPKMSTYLLFLAVGDFERISRDVDGVDVGVITRRGQTASGRFALDAAAEVLPYFNDYFGTPYPLPKLDMVAIPGESAFFSAMENWGAILYFDRALLVDPRLSSESDRQNVFGTVAHEVAHQWFGNLVTMQWWDDLWLNEGYASWMASKAADVLHPQWRTFAQDLQGIDAAMALDARGETHPVVLPIIDAADASFDSITYNKGQGVIRMVEAFVGDAPFKAGIQGYMSAHAYGNTVSDDLWSALETGSGAPVRHVARNFIDIPGVPLVSVSGARCEAGKLRFDLAQRRFSVDDPAAAGQWTIPLAYSAGGAPGRLLLDGAQAAEAAGCGPLVLNAGAAGYYRVTYDAASFAPIPAAFGAMAPADQLGLLYDRWALGLAGVEPLARYFDLVADLPAEADPLVWRQAATVLGKADGFYEDGPARGAYRKQAISLLQQAWVHTGWEARADEPPSRAQLRETLITTLGALGDAAVIDEARRRVAASKDDPAALPAAVRAQAIGVVSMHADTARWEATRAQAKAATAFLEQQQLYAALGKARDVALARRTLDLALSEEAPKTMRFRLVRAVAQAHPKLTWDFMMAHEAALNALFAPSNLSSFLAGTVDGWNDPDLAEAAAAYVAAHPPAAEAGEVAAAIGSIGLNARQQAPARDQIDAWVAAR